MELQLAYQEGHVLASTSGQIDDTAERLFRQHLHPLFAERGAKVVLDLASSQRITSSGVGQLVVLVANANTNGGRVILAGLSPFVAIVLSRSKLDKYFEIAPDVKDAVQLLQE